MAHITGGGPLIAVDGTAASGKGTIARAIARYFNIPHLDTGALYRTVALATLRDGIAFDNVDAIAVKARALDLSLLEHPDLRSSETADAASRISAIPAVRAGIFDFQRDFATRDSGAVLDGRDIGTVIAPDADVKLFIVARPTVRARRRFLELCTTKADVDEASILADIIARDARDSAREDAPLRQAEDAILLDTSDSDIEDAVGKAIQLVANRLERAA